MRIFFTFFLVLIFNAVNFVSAQNHFVESFENASTTWSGYTTNTVTFPSGVWDFVSVFPELSGDSQDGSKACRINDDIANASITTPAVDGVGVVSFYYHRPFGGTGSFTLEKKVGSGSWTVLSTVNFDNVTVPTLYTINVNEASNDVQIRIVNDDNTAHLTIDLFTMGEFSSTDPTVSFDMASSSVSENVGSIMIDVSMSNYGGSSVSVSITPQDVTSESGDYVLSTSSLTFSADGTQQVNLTINDDVDTDDEELTLTLAVTSGTADLGTNPHTLTITDNDVAPAPELVITEIMYNSATPGTDDEWIEICNIGTVDADVSDYEVRTNGSLRVTFPMSSMITAGECVTVELGDGDGTDFNALCPFTADYGTSITSTNVLNNSAGIVRIDDDMGATLDEVSYDDGDGADGNGSSLHIIDATMDNSTTGSNWQEVSNGGSPGVNSLTQLCPDCSITAISGTASCSGNDAEVVVTYTATDGSGTYEVDINGEGYQTIASGGTYTITGPTTAVTGATISVRDVSETTCAGSATVDIPECGCTASITVGTIICDATTPGTDTYTATFDFLNGSEAENLTVSLSSGSSTISTIGSDGPIEVTGISEGTDVTITLTNSNCSIMATATSPVCGTPDVRINEVDSSPSEDEFIELFGASNLSLSGLVVVFYNGNGNTSYAAYDLDGYTLDANGYFIIGKSSAMPGGVAAPEILLSTIQDGTDAVGLYVGDAADFPNGTSVTGSGIIDACVYASGDPDNSVLRNTLGFTLANDHADLPINEAENGARATQSVQRGSWFVADRTPRAFNALPIELISFTANKDEERIILNWTTASEINNDKFIIEHSADGRSFDAIAEIKGAGTTNEKQVYSYIFEKPYTGMNYFRIKQMDYDGQSALSSIRTVNMKQVIKGNGYVLSPNPVRDVLSISREGNAAGKLSVYDTQGKRIISNISIENGQTIDVTTWVPGTYFFQIQAVDGLIENKRIVVMP